MSRTEKRKFNKLHYVDSELVTKKNKVEAVPQTFQMSYHLHRPWSDILLETHLPPMILEKMIEISDEGLADSKRISWGENLAGQIKEELLI